MIGSGEESGKRNQHANGRIVGLGSRKEDLVGNESDSHLCCRMP